uniref:Uncharacterized protein n=1 Tax=Rhizophora mucronata TaxID=61149 RepID=A0A2P2Q3A6_RHIMU
MMTKKGKKKLLMVNRCAKRMTTCLSFAQTTQKEKIKKSIYIWGYMVTRVENRLTRIQLGIIRTMIKA